MPVNKILLRADKAIWKSFRVILICADLRLPAPNFLAPPENEAQDMSHVHFSL